MKRLAENAENFGFIDTSIPASEETEALEAKFEDGEYVSREQVRDYAHKIAEAVNEISSPDEQRLILMDFLKDKEILTFADLMTKVEYPEFFKLKKKNKVTGKFEVDEKKLKEIKLMVLDTIKAIKKQIIYELQGQLSDDLFFFIKAQIEPDKKSINKKMILSDSEFNELFFKETQNLPPELIIDRYNNLKKLSAAFDSLENPETDMPYVIRPRIIEESKKKLADYNPSVGYAVDTKDLITIEDIFVNEKYTKEITTKEALLAIIDCLRGEKFLADNNLTLTDINTIDIGKNFGIDKKTKKGILFDLDGLQKAGQATPGLIGPRDLGKDGLTSNFPPEYHPLVMGESNVVAVSKSMIWETGETLRRIAAKQIFKLKYNAKNLDEQKNLQMIEAWTQIMTFSNEMIARNPDDRPDFDYCIDKLTKIVEEFFPEETY
ncbi:MAG: hypothetical protein WCV83_03530 [Candidatus Magasanikbacteria bacterium]|jgi:hypothetical protein